jgi:TRAP-type C4-dicarboxylate transport system permease small subunit
MDNPISKVALPLARLLAIISGYGILVVCFAICVEIVGRKLFGFTLQGIDDIGGFTLAIAAAVGASYTMAQRGHTRIDVFLVRMPERVQAILNTLAMVGMAVFACYALWRGSYVLEESLLFKSVATNPLQTPLAWPQSVWIAGLALFAVISLAYALHALWLLYAMPKKINRFYGPSTAQDEIEAELAARAVQAASENPGAPR